MSGPTLPDAGDPDNPVLAARILIVDDQPANLELLERLLAHEGFRAYRSVSRGEEAVSAFVEFEPDIVLLDLLMPGVDGYAVLEGLSRRIPADTFLPILVLTADVSLPARRRALALGAKDFVTKPFDLIELLMRVHSLLETRRKFLRLARIAGDG